MTNPAGQSFLSYKRCRAEEARLLIETQHDHGIPTWQDVESLGFTHTEDTIRMVLDDPDTASSVLLITPEVKDSPMIRNVEIPKSVRRAEAGDGFFVVPVAGGGLSYAEASNATTNALSAQRLSDWNMYRADKTPLDHAAAVVIAQRILTHRLQAIHRSLPAGEPLTLGLFARRRPASDTGTAILLDWFDRFMGKQASPETWREVLLPALARVRDAISRFAPGRPVVASGLPTLPAALALGQTFSSTSGLSLSWRQSAPGLPDKVWSLDSPRESTAFETSFTGKDLNARDLAVLVSVVDDTEPLFAAWQSEAAPIRAMVHVRHRTEPRFTVRSPGQAVDIALTVQEAIREARREYGNIGRVHAFVAAPAGLAVLIGQLLNTLGEVRTYEHVNVDGSGRYEPAALLQPCS